MFLPSLSSICTFSRLTAIVIVALVVGCTDASEEMDQVPPGDASFPRNELRAIAAAEQLGARGDYLGAIALLEQNLDPDDAPPRALAYLAFSYLRAGNAMRSIQLAHQALRGSLEPDLLVDLHYSLAEAHVNQGEFSKALKESDITLSLAPDHLGALHMNAVSLQHSGKHDEADRIARLILARDVSHIAAHFVRGLAAVSLRHPSEARAAFLRVVELDPGARTPEGREARYQAAKALADMGEGPEAEVAMKGVMSADPYDPRPVLGLLKLYRRSGRETEAEAMLPHFTRRQTLADEMRNLTIAAQSDPSGKLMARLAELYVSRRELAAAAQTLTTALTLDPKQVEWRRRLAEITRERGR
ncbi:MAG: hypothetical protein O7H41_20700 [Planctomycetota bacterium]|nr:hypothetical protein [Planctomycetota bacterium]